MLFDVIQKELEDCIYGYRSVLLFALSVLLFAVSVYTGAREYQTALQEYRLAQAAHRRAAAEQNNLYALATFGVDLVKPPQLLGILVSGVEPHTPHVYNVSLFSLPEPQGSTASETPTSAVFGVLDMFFIVQVVLGLAALLFTFSAVCGEKESGTLKLQLANALPKDVLLLGKLIGNLTGLLFPVLVAFLLGCLMLTGFDGVFLAPDDLVRILFLGIDFLLYLTVLFALGLWVSTLTNRSTTAFALCLVAWVLLVVITPRFAVLAAKQISPMESLQEFQMKRMAVHRAGTVEAQEQLHKYEEEHHVGMPPPRVYYDLVAQIRDKQNAQLRKIEEDYLERKHLQERWAQLLSRVSPAGSASYAAMSLARTGLDRDIRFRATLRDYRSEFTRYYDSRSRETVALAENGDAPSGTGQKNFYDLPSFEFHEESLGVSLERALPDIGYLAVWSLSFFALAYFRFLHYDVR